MLLNTWPGHTDRRKLVRLANGSECKSIAECLQWQTVTEWGYRVDAIRARQICENQSARWYTRPCFHGLCIQQTTWRCNSKRRKEGQRSGRYLSSIGTKWWSAIGACNEYEACLVGHAQANPAQSRPQLWRIVPLLASWDHLWSACWLEKLWLHNV